MSQPEYDLFVIGGGSGGVRAARRAAELGARVALAEERELGGTCVNRGCIPKKLLVYASHVRAAIENAERGYGWKVGERSFSWRRFRQAKDREIARLNRVYAELLDGAGVKRIQGRARLLDPHTVAVGAQRVRARHVLVATGAVPSVPPLPGAELAVTSDDAFHWDALPERVVIVGGGYVAVEFAGILHGLGARVVQLYRGPRFLRGFDDTVREHMAGEMRKRGVDLRFTCDVKAIERRDGALRVRLDDGDVLECDRLLFATGRAPNTRDLGLAEAGVELDANGAVRVDAYSRSSVPSVWAVGDVTNRLNLTPVALHEGECLARTLFGGTPTAPDHRDVPTTVFGQPALGSVGLTEAEARERHSGVEVYASAFRPLEHTLTGRDERTLVKLVVERESDRVLGVHLVGPEAGEILQGFAVALKAGATKAVFDATLGIHPTTAEEFVTLREPLAKGG